MICKTFDYAAAHKQMMTEVDAHLAARTPAQVAEDQAKTAQSWEKIKEIYTNMSSGFKKAANLDRFRDFLSTANMLRRFTKEQAGWIRISVDKGWNGNIDMRFDQILFMDHDRGHTHANFASLFHHFRDITFSSYKGKVRIQIHCELYDLVSIPEVDEQSHC